MESPEYETYDGLQVPYVQDWSKVDANKMCDEFDSSEFECFGIHCDHCIMDCDDREVLKSYIVHREQQHRQDSLTGQLGRMEQKLDNILHLITKYLESK